LLIAVTTLSTMFSFFDYMNWDLDACLVVLQLIVACHLHVFSRKNILQ
jgi:hypothetical protein